MAKPVRRGNKKTTKVNNTFREFKPRAELVTQINYEDGITVSALAEKLNKNSSDLIKFIAPWSNELNPDDLSTVTSFRCPSFVITIFAYTIPCCFKRSAILG